MSFADGVVNSIERYKRGAYFSPDYLGNHSWNGFERNLLFESMGNRRFTDVARAAGVDEIKDSRAVAVADLNKDGRLDLVIQNNHETPTFYLNRSSEQGHFVQVKLVGSGEVNRDAVGTRVQIVCADDNGNLNRLNRWVEAGNGHASQSPLSLHFGLGSSGKPVSMEVFWTDGSSNRIEEDLDQMIDRTISIEKKGTQIAMQIDGDERIKVASLDKGKQQ